MDSAEGYFSMGDLYTMRKRYGEAEQWYRKSYEIQEELFEETDTPVVWRLLSRTCSMLGNLGMASTNPVKRGEAMEWHQKALEMDLKLAKASGTPQSYDDLACSYSGLGSLTNDISLQEKALSIWQDLQRKYPEEALYRERVETEISNIEKVRAYLKRKR
jgi:tetratricopeptide (TPR) repeat protein